MALSMINRDFDPRYAPSPTPWLRRLIGGAFSAGFDGNIGSLVDHAVLSSPRDLTKEEAGSCFQALP